MISISLFTPVWSSQQIGRADDLGARATDYSHKIAAVGGYMEADFSLPMSLAEALGYWRDALGWHVEVKSPGGSPIWEGFINHIEVSVGVITLERGPLLDVVNRAWMKYQTVSYATNPPIGGQPITTAVVNDTTSQGKYGILEGFLSGGEATSTLAGQAVATFLAENKDPRAEIPGLTLSENESAAPAVITFSCAGYVRLLEKYYYANTGGSSTVNLSAKISTILAADPSSRFSSSTKRIDTNTTAVPAYSDGETDAWGQIEEMLGWGDSNDARYLFQILDGRIAHYFAIPDEVFYLFGLTDPAQRIRLAGEMTVARWDVKAARWLFVTDLLSGEIPASNLRRDSRAIFIESAEYTTPWHIALAGGQANTLPQLLKRMGI